MEVKKIKLSNSRIFSLGLFAFLFGITVACFWNFDFMILAMALIGSFTFALAGRRNRWLWAFFFCIAGFSLGFYKASSEIEKIETSYEGSFSGKVMVAKEPEISDEYQKVEVMILPESRKISTKHSQKIERYDNYQKVVTVRTEQFYPKRTLLFTDPNVNYEYGQILQVNCTLEKPQNKYEKFNYQRFLAQKGIFRVCRRPQIKKTGENQGSKFLVMIYKSRRVLENKINQNFTMPQSAFLAGLLLGGEKRLPTKTAEDFRRTGTTHVVAVSGSNITIIAAMVMCLMISLGFWRNQAFWLSIAAITIFVVMIGAPSSATRAAIMGSLVLWAAKNGRLGDSTRAVLLTAVIMSWLSPLILVYDAGFQLSVLATLGIILVYPPLAERFNITEDFLELKSIILTTVCAQLGVLGLTLYQFETFSPVSFLANLIILPAIPLIMLFGFIVVLISFVSSFLAQMLALPVWMALYLEIKAIELLAQIPWASIDIKGLSPWFLALYYLFFFLLVKWLNKKLPPK